MIARRLGVEKRKRRGLRVTQTKAERSSSAFPFSAQHEWLSMCTNEKGCFSSKRQSINFCKKK
jgi:hypothetical protein